MKKLMAMLVAFSMFFGVTAGAVPVAGFPAPADETSAEVPDGGEIVFDELPEDGDNLADDNPSGGVDITDDNAADDNPSGGEEDITDDNTVDDNPSTEEPSNSGVEIITPDVDENGGNQAFFDYLDSMRDLEFTGANIHFAMVTTGMNLVLDSRNDVPLEEIRDIPGIDERMFNFGYVSEYDTYVDFIDLPNDMILEKVETLGIYSMDELIDWMSSDAFIETLPSTIGLWDEFYIGSSDDKGTPKYVTIAVSGFGTVGGYKTNIDNNSITTQYTEDTIQGYVTFPENGLVITPMSGYEIKSISFGENGGEAYKVTAEGQVNDLDTLFNGSSSEQVTDLLTVATKGENGEYTLSKEALTKSLPANKGDVLIYPYVQQSGRGQQKTTSGALKLVVETAPATFNGTVTVSEYDVPETGPSYGYTFTNNAIGNSLNGRNISGNNTLQTAINTALSNAKKGDTFEITYDESVIAGVGVNSGNNVTIHGNSVSFAAGDQDLNLAFVYKPEITAIHIDDAKQDGEKKSDETFFSTYLSQCICTIDNHSYTHTSYQDMNKELKSLLKDGMTISSMTFTFKTNDRIDNSSLGSANPDGVTVNRIPITGKKYSTYGSSEGGIEGAIKGNWSDANSLEPFADSVSTFTPDGDMSNNSITLSLTLVNNEPKIQFSAYAVNGTSSSPTGHQGVVVVAEVSGDDLDGRISVNGWFTGTGSDTYANPNYNNYSKYRGDLNEISTGNFPRENTEGSLNSTDKKYWGLQFVPNNGYEIRYDYKYSVEVTAETGGGKTVGTVDVDIKHSPSPNNYVVPYLSNANNATINSNANGTPSN